MTDKIWISSLQADIIFKALHYAAFNEKIDIPVECEEVFRVLAEENPRETHVEHTIEVMDFLCSFIKDSESYKGYFKAENEDEDE